MTKNNPLFDLTGRTALVTGSSQGIGRGLAEGLARAGARVVINARDAAKLKAARDAMRAAGMSVESAAFDVTDREAVIAGIKAIEADVGPIDILINNAGIQRRGAFEDYPVATWHEIFAANTHSAFHVTQAVVRGMLTRKRGKIINICSVMSELGRASIIPYAATKGALKMMTKGMCAEWGRHNIQTNAISPGYIKTELNNALIADKTFSDWVCARTPAGRWADPEELAGAAVFLASRASDYVNGQIIYVDGGMTAVV